MQQAPRSNPRDHFHLPRRPARRWPGVVGLVCLLAVSGCGGDSTKSTDPAPKTFGGVLITLRCADPAFAEAVTPAAHSWAGRNSAQVKVLAEPMTPGDDTDVAILPVPELGGWAARGELAPVPSSLQNAPTHAFQWSGLLPAYREQLVGWGGQTLAVPLAGDGFVIVYRADRLDDPKFAESFRKANGRDPAPPATWEEFVDLAAALASYDGKPSLPPPAGPDLADLFFRAAACHDRPALSDAQKQEGLSFQFDLATGEPRLSAPGFAAAAGGLARLTEKKCFPPTPAGAAADPAAALADGRASLAVLSLAQLAKLPREGGVVPARFRLVPLPGARTFTDPRRGELVPAAAPNYVPYFAGGRVGVVRTRCSSPDAAFELLADLGGPTRSLEILSNPALGAGPFRGAHLERDQLQVWYGYGFDADRSKALQDALRQYTRQEVKNPVFGLRGPDQAALSAAAADELVKVASGATKADAALARIGEAWKQIDAQTPKDKRLQWRRLAAGQN
jgi:multiple sugar transport system substrate-binding protein